MPDVSKKTDKELIRCAAEGDHVAFETLVRRYSQPLAEFAAGKTNSVQDAEDIVQETFLRAFVHLKLFDDRYAVKNWLFTIAYRLIITGYRKKQPLLLNHETFAAMTGTSAETVSGTDRLWELAGELDRPLYTVLWLRYKQAMEVSDIAQVMNKSKIGVRVLLHRARRRLAERAETLEDRDPMVSWPAPNPVLTERIKPR